MDKPKTNIAIAALDIGSSQVKVGVYAPQLSSKVIILNSHKNELSINSNREVLSDYDLTKHYADLLFKALGEFVKKNNITTLYIGVCSHVSSLLEWDCITEKPISNMFPIWLDGTCKNNIEDLKEFMKDGNDRKLIGSFLPLGTNWLFTKLLGVKEKQRENTKYLQVGDAIVYELTGEYLTHSSSQVSIVHQQKNIYVHEILSYLNINSNQLPEIKNTDLIHVKSSECKRFGFPQNTLVLPSMADFYASFHGLDLAENDAFILGNTSEIVGIYQNDVFQPKNNFVNVSYNNGQVSYGSTNTGGNLINWFFEKIMNTNLSAHSINEISIKASRLSPTETPIFLPYLEGERAPFWNSELSASFIGLRSFHTNIHLFRAILESVAFARKQCFDELSKDKLSVVKMGGGTSQNTLWNEIRASVLNCDISVTEEKELAIVGVINNILILLPQEFVMNNPEMNYSKTSPNKDLQKIYHDKYNQFIHLQKILNQ